MDFTTYCIYFGKVSESKDGGGAIFSNCLSLRIANCLCSSILNVQTLDLPIISSEQKQLMTSSVDNSLFAMHIQHENLYIIMNSDELSTLRFGGLNRSLHLHGNQPRHQGTKVSTAHGGDSIRIAGI